MTISLPTSSLGAERPRAAIPRFLAALVMCVVVLTGTTGCGFFVDENAYRPSAGDGVNIEGVGPLAVRNVLVVANDAGTEGHLVAAIVNNSDEPQVLRIEVGEQSDAALEIRVPAESTVSYGQRDSLEDPPLIEGIDAIAGSMVRMSFQAGDSEPVAEEVPVLGGCLEYLRGLEPEQRGDSDECPWYIDE